VYQSKNPDRMRAWLDKMPPDRLLGCTIESTEGDVIRQVSEAPHPLMRCKAMCELHGEGERVYLTIEPILRGDMRRLAQWCAMIMPEFVNVGADSKGTGLPEPAPAEVVHLLDQLQMLYGGDVRLKSNLGRLRM